MTSSSFAKKLIPSALVAASAVVLSTLAAPAQAATVISGFTTGGDDMDGMEITVDFLNGSSETVTWGTTGANAGGAFGTDWSLNLVGSTTISTPWTFTNTGNLIGSLAINAIPGNTVFDTNSFPSTPGSVGGRTFNVVSGLAPDSFNYSVPIDISLGDLFGTLSMQWDNGFSGNMQFLADTDNGTADNPVQPDQPDQPDTDNGTTDELVQPDQPDQPDTDNGTTDELVQPAQSVPEPASLLGLLAVGAFGAGSALKRKQQA